MADNLVKCQWIECFNKACAVLLKESNKTIYCEKHLRVWFQLSSPKIVQHLRPRQISGLLKKTRQDILKRFGSPGEIANNPIVYTYHSLEIAFDTDDKVEMIYDNPEKGGSGVFIK